MATVYSTIRGHQRSASNLLVGTPPPDGKFPIIAEYLAAALATAQTIDMATIPAGHSYRLREVNYAALGAGTSLVGGRSGATDEQLSSISTVAAASSPANNGFWRYCATEESFVLTNVGTLTGRIQVELEVVRGNVATNQA